MRLFNTRFAPAALAVLAFGALAIPASATTVISTVGGQPLSGNTYVNFDNCAGNIACTSNGVNVSYVPDGTSLTGAVSGIAAAPFISNSNGVLFGDSTVAGADATTYLSTGIGHVKLDFGSDQTYLGLLWGSDDNYNVLTLLEDGNVVATITGLDVFGAANGDQGVNGTFYTNIFSNVAFNQADFTSSQYAFEFDNVAYGVDKPPGAPEPASLALMGAGLAGFGLKRRKDKKSSNDNFSALAA